MIIFQQIKANQFHLCRFLSDVLVKMVMYSSYNVMMCSKTGVMSSILKHLKQDDPLQPDARGCLLYSTAKN
jgi:hypothetical protein